MKKKYGCMLALIGSFFFNYTGMAVPLTMPYFDNTTDLAYAVSNSDLVNAGSAALLAPPTYSDPLNYGSSLNINNGALGTAGNTGSISIVEGGTYTITFDFNVSLNAFGYDITNIRTFSGWPDGRVYQDYSVAYRLVGTPPSSYISLGSFSKTSGALGGGGNSILLDITDDTGVLASGVDSLRFTINRVNAPGYGLLGTAYREIDVFGAATVVPEPSTAALVIGGCLTFLLARKKGGLV
jgi:hypothetical protein